MDLIWIIDFRLLDLVTVNTHDSYLKLIVASLNYSGVGSGNRNILSKVLVSPSEAARLFTTRYLRTLARAHIPEFHKWGVELLVAQLYDQSPAVSLAALDVLQELCDEEVFLSLLSCLH